MSVRIEALARNAAAAEGRAAVARFAAHLGTKLKALAVSLTRRKAIESLGRLDDRMLADIGLTRSDLRAAREWSLWGDPTERLAEVAEERRAARLAARRERVGVISEG